jgi:hypothetical protein
MKLKVNGNGSIELVTSRSPGETTLWRKRCVWGDENNSCEDEFEVKKLRELRFAENGPRPLQAGLVLSGMLTNAGAWRHPISFFFGLGRTGDQRKQSVRHSLKVALIVVVCFAMFCAAVLTSAPTSSKSLGGLRAGHFKKASPCFQ